jgi:hypothetical protein
MAIAAVDPADLPLQSVLNSDAIEPTEWTVFQSVRVHHIGVLLLLELNSNFAAKNKIVELHPVQQGKL